MLEKTKSWLLNNKTVALIIIALLALAAFMSYRQSLAEKKMRQAIVLREEQAKNYQIVSEELKLEKEQSKQLADFIDKSLGSEKKPQIIYNYQTTTAETKKQAADEIANKINNKDSSLPGIMLEKSDRTLVSDISDETEAKTGYQVGVWKVWTAPKTLAGPVIGFNPMDHGIKPDYVGYEKLWNLKSTDKPPAYFGAEVGVNNLNDAFSDSFRNAKVEIKIKYLK